MKQLDSRRYTGPNVVWRHAGAVLDVECTPDEADCLVPAFTSVARQLLDAVGWHDEQVAAHRFSNGVSLAISAPVDALYTAVDLAESAYDLVCPPGHDDAAARNLARPQGHSDDAAAHNLASPQGHSDDAAARNLARPQGHSDDAAARNLASPQGHSDDAAAHNLARPQGHSDDAAARNLASPQGHSDDAAARNLARPQGHSDDAAAHNLARPPLGEDHDGVADVRRGQCEVLPDPEALATAIARLRESVAKEVNPPLLALRQAARSYGVAFLSDDDEASVGHGRGCRVWPVDALPAPDEVPWPELHNVPVGLVTGTNGKTTSVRMATAIARSAGRNVGFSSTDWVGVNDEVIDRGDYSGPGGARAALRDPRVDMAILETARGGLLRRGLGVEHADAALITTIAEDHLGDFGSGCLSELLDVKWVVTRALNESSCAVLNADDELLVGKARDAGFPITWYALDPANTVLAAHCGRGGKAMSVVDGSLAHFDRARWHRLCQVADIPLTMKGAARYNVANALGAAGLALALGLDYASIVTGLCGMTAADNPGRGNLFRVGGVEVLIDFAHNPQAIAAVFELALQQPARRRLLAFSQAGDRTDTQIRELAQVAWNVGLDRVIVSELAQYYRGRKPGEVFAILQDELLRCGARPGQIDHFETELASLQAALNWAQPGDLVIMLALGDARGVLAHLHEVSQPTS